MQLCLDIYLLFDNNAIMIYTQCTPQFTVNSQNDELTIILPFPPTTSFWRSLNMPKMAHEAKNCRPRTRSNHSECVALVFQQGTFHPIRPLPTIPRHSPTHPPLTPSPPSLTAEKKQIWESAATLATNAVKPEDAASPSTRRGSSRWEGSLP